LSPFSWDLRPRLRTPDLVGTYGDTFVPQRKHVFASAILPATLN